MLEGSIVDEVVNVNGVKVVGVSFLASKVSSMLLLLSQIILLIGLLIFIMKRSTQIDFDFEDEVIQSSVLAYEGKIMNERFA